MKKIWIYSSILIIIDQLVKLIVATNLKYNSSIIIIDGFLKITYIKNTGAAFSILEGNRLFLILIALIAIFGIYVFCIKNKKLNKIDWITYVLIISGIIGNLLDRIIFGYVIDYIDFKILDYNMPIFNLADSFIVIGAIILLITTLLEEQNDRIQNKKRK